MTSAITGSYTLAVGSKNSVLRHGPTLGSGSRVSIRVKKQKLVTGKLKDSYLIVHSSIVSPYLHRDERSSSVQESWFSTAILCGLIYYGDLA